MRRESCNGMVLLPNSVQFLKQFHYQGITGLNACIQTEAEDLFIVDGGLLCYINAIISSLNR